MNIETNWEVTISRVQNGYIIKTPKESEDRIDTNIVVQEREGADEEEMEQRALREVFYTLKEYFGVNNSKHYKTNLILNIEKRKDND